MDAVIVGLVTALAAVVSLQFWRLLVRPDDVLEPWSERDDAQQLWFGHDPGAVRVLRVLGASLIFLLGFLTGLLLVLLPTAAG